jgi:hypothetical protein
MAAFVRRFRRREDFLEDPIPALDHALRLARAVVEKELVFVVLD